MKENKIVFHKIQYNSLTIISMKKVKHKCRLCGFYISINQFLKDKYLRFCNQCDTFFGEKEKWKS